MVKEQFVYVVPPQRGDCDCECDCSGKCKGDCCDCDDGDYENIFSQKEKLERYMKSRGKVTVRVYAYTETVAVTASTKIRREDNGKELK